MQVFDQPMLVTGAAGFVGAALTARAYGHDVVSRVVCTDRVPAPQHVDPGVEWHVVDLTDAFAVEALLRKVRPGVIMHLAGLARGSDWEALYSANVLTTVGLLEVAERTVPGCTVVIPGSAAEYGPVPAERLPVTEGQPLTPISPYGVIKATQSLAAMMFRVRGVDVRVARLFNIIGPGMPESFALGAFARQLHDIATGECDAVLTTGYLDSRRDFLDVRDVATALLAVARAGSAAEVYNVCSGVGITMRTCLEMLVSHAGLDVVVHSSQSNDSAAILDSVGSAAKLRSATGWQPEIDLERTIADIWDAYLSH